MLSPSTRRLAGLLEAWPSRLERLTVWPARPGRTARFDDGGQHRHTIPTLVSCLDGVVRVRSVHGSIDLHPGAALVIAPGVWHRHEDLRHGAASLGMGSFGPWCDIALLDVGTTTWGRLPAEPARGLLARLLAASDEGERLRLLRDLAAQLVSERVEPLAFPHPAVERMLAKLWTRLDRGITAADLVAASGLGRSQAYALFTRVLGISPKRAVEQARRELARHLLAAGCSSDEVVRACGYGDRRAMARIHRRTDRQATH
jgi:AraC-like DNA-binding protein